jgi:hypothetical protein
MGAVLRSYGFYKSAINSNYSNYTPNMRGGNSYGGYSGNMSYGRGMNMNRANESDMYSNADRYSRNNRDYM